MESQPVITISAILILPLIGLLAKTIAQEIGESWAHRVFINKKKRKVHILLQELNEKVEKRIKEVEAGEKIKAETL